MTAPSLAWCGRFTDFEFVSEAIIYFTHGGPWSPFRAIRLYSFRGTIMRLRIMTAPLTAWCSRPAIVGTSLVMVGCLAPDSDSTATQESPSAESEQDGAVSGSVSESAEQQNATRDADRIQRARAALPPEQRILGVWVLDVDKTLETWPPAIRDLMEDDPVRKSALGESVWTFKANGEARLVGAKQGDPSDLELVEAEWEIQEDKLQISGGGKREYHAVFVSRAKSDPRDSI